MGCVMRAVLLLALGLTCAACATSGVRYKRYRIQVSVLCSVTLIRDLRTEACFMAYHCGILRGGVALVETSPEVCKP